MYMYTAAMQIKKQTRLDKRMRLNLQFRSSQSRCRVLTFVKQASKTKELEASTCLVDSRKFDFTAAFCASCLYKHISNLRILSAILRHTEAVRHEKSAGIQRLQK